MTFPEPMMSIFGQIMADTEHALTAACQAQPGIGVLVPLQALATMGRVSVRETPGSWVECDYLLDGQVVMMRRVSDDGQIAYYVRPVEEVLH